MLKEKEKSPAIRLHFDTLGVHRVVFSHPLLEGPRVAVRGKSGDSYHEYLSFQWSAAVRALALLLVRTRLFALDRTRCPDPTLEGGAGSMAATLDYAFNKSPSWLEQIFSLDKRGRSLAFRLFHRENPRRKRGEVVRISVNTRVLDPLRISIELRGREADVLDLEKLVGILAAGSSKQPALWKSQASFSAVLADEIRFSLAANDIFASPSVMRTLEKFAKSRTFQKISHGVDCTLSLIDRDLTSVERLGLKSFDLSALKGREYRVAVATGHVASLSLFDYLRSSGGIKLSIDFSSGHSTGLAEMMRKQQDVGEFACLSLAPAASLIGEGPRSSYLPLMMMPSQRVCMLEKSTPDSSAVSEYQLLTGLSTAQMVFDQLRCRGVIDSSTRVKHVEPHEILSGMNECAFTCRSILGFPYNFFVHTLIPGVQYVRLPEDLSWKETFLFARRDLYETPEILKTLDVALRNAWLTLLEDSTLRAKVARRIALSTEFKRVLKRQAGIVAYENW